MIAVTAKAQPACDDVEFLLSASVDDELDDDDSAVVHSHVSSCPICRTRLQELRAIKAALSSAGRLLELPQALHAQLRLDLDRAARPARRLRAGLLGAGGVLACIVIAAFVRTPTTSAATLTAPVVRAALQRHRAELPVDVASPDPRPVQAFLASRLGHPPRVPRLDGFGFGLQGARVVDIEDRQAAQLRYSGGFGQRISVVALPDPDGSLATRVLANHRQLSSSSEGLSVRVLASGGNLYTLVGDLDEHRLERIAHELER